jgi:hypothetical protein
MMAHATRRLDLILGGERMVRFIDEQIQTLENNLANTPEIHIDPELDKSTTEYFDLRVKQGERKRDEDLIRRLRELKHVTVNNDSWLEHPTWVAIRRILHERRTERQ